MKDMNVVVIGAGPGGYVSAIRAAQLGAQVTIIEKREMGGTCLNAGCIPTKVLLHAAEFMTMKSEAEDFGIRVGEISYDWERVINKKNEIINKLKQGVSSLMDANKIEKIQGEASFCSPEILKVVLSDGTEKKITPDKIIISTGSVPVIPPIPGLKESQKCIDSTKALSLETVPKSIIVIGGGVIGIEMATAYSSFGAEVTIVEATPKILPLMDHELGAMLQRRLKKNKVNILTGTKVTAIQDTDDGVNVTISASEQEKTISAEIVIVAVGRRSYTDTLNIVASGIEQERTGIKINKKMETNVPGIYAIGDCTGSTMLAHVASSQGEIAAENALGADKEYDETTCPFCVYTNPEFAGVGLTEDQAVEKGHKIKVGKFPLKANGKALIMNNGEGVVKIIADEETGVLLGVHILGSRATDLISEAAMAIGMKATLDDLISVIHAHPTLSEAVREGALAAQNMAIHIPNKK